MFPFPLLLTVASSRRLAFALGLLHFSALAAVWLASLPMGMQLAASLGVGFSLYRHSRPQPPIRLRCHADGRLEIWQTGIWRQAEAIHPAMLLPWLTVLRYRPHGQRHMSTQVITPDSLPEDDFRRLRVWLRWGVSSSED